MIKILRALGTALGTAQNAWTNGGVLAAKLGVKVGAQLRLATFEDAGASRLEAQGWTRATAPQHSDVMAALQKTMAAEQGTSRAREIGHLLSGPLPPHTIHSPDGLIYLTYEAEGPWPADVAPPNAAVSRPLLERMQFGEVSSEILDILSHTVPASTVELLNRAGVQIVEGDTFQLSPNEQKRLGPLAARIMGRLLPGAGSHGEASLQLRQVRVVAGILPEAAAQFLRHEFSHLLLLWAEQNGRLDLDRWKTEYQRLRKSPEHLTHRSEAEVFEFMPEATSIFMARHECDLPDPRFIARARMQHLSPEGYALAHQLLGEDVTAMLADPKMHAAPGAADAICERWIEVMTEPIRQNRMNRIWTDLYIDLATALSGLACARRDPQILDTAFKTLERARDELTRDIRATRSGRGAGQSPPELEIAGLEREMEEVRQLLSVP